MKLVKTLTTCVYCSKTEYLDIPEGTHIQVMCRSCYWERNSEYNARNPQP